VNWVTAHVGYPGYGAPDPGERGLCATSPEPAGHPRRERMRGLVQGGQDVGGGRSVAPTRDALVPEGGGNPPTPEQEDAAQAGNAPARHSGRPMDL
jgi:hypothetical protein